MSLSTVLPAPKAPASLAPEEEEDAMEVEQEEFEAPKNIAPPYGQRQNWIPRHVEDYGDGGAFPEIHVAQYPLEMGRKGRGAMSTSVSLSLGADGKVQYDAILGKHSGALTVPKKNTDLIALGHSEAELAKPSDEEIEETAIATKRALEKIVDSKVSASHPANPASQRGPATYFKYTPLQKGQNFNSGASQRTVRMVEMPLDPLEPPKFRSKKIPRGPPSPPVPVMHSPPKKVSIKDQQAWKIPPSISNWKNNKGYTIPLDKRLAADGRGLQDPRINDGFAKLSEALYIAERNAREEVAKRSQIQHKIVVQEKEKKEQELRALANRARMERSQTQETVPDSLVAGSEPEHEAKETEAARQEREQLREERRRDREREHRLDAYKGKRTKWNRDEERDTAEAMALGQAPAGVPTGGGEIQFDQRLMNQSQGLDSGFGDEEDYSVYSKPMSSGVSEQVYRPHVDGETYGANDMEKIVQTDRFKPDRDFSGVDRTQPSEPHTKPVEFEKEQDPFGLDEFLDKAKKSSGRSNPLDKIGTGSMHAASASFGSRHTYDEGDSGRSKRKAVDFAEGDKPSPKRRRK